MITEESNTSSSIIDSKKVYGRIKLFIGDEEIKLEPCNPDDLGCFIVASEEEFREMLVPGKNQHILDQLDNMKKEIEEEDRANSNIRINILEK